MNTPRFYLEHILDQVQYLSAATEGLTKGAFLQDRTLILAFERSLEIIGEATAKLDDSFKAEHTQIPWRKMRGLRSIVAHVYWEVDLDIIWHTVTVDVPILGDELERLLEQLP